MASYLVADNKVEKEIVVTRSRFICYLSPCNSPEQAKAILKALKQQHPQARHHCYAFIAGRPDNSQLYGFSDDGEPSGSAGKPMLSVLLGQNVGELCAVVVRYFGGTKLGVGGLQRAYSASVKEALVELKTTLKVPNTKKKIACEYTQINDILHLLKQFQGEVLSQSYLEKVELTVILPCATLTDFQQQLQTLSAGQVELESIERETLEIENIIEK